MCLCVTFPGEVINFAKLCFDLQPTIEATTALNNNMTNVTQRYKLFHSTLLLNIRNDPAKNCMIAIERSPSLTRIEYNFENRLGSNPSQL